MASLPGLNHLWDEAGWVLQVRVQIDNCITDGEVMAARERDLVSEVAGKPDTLYPRMLLGAGGDEVPGRILTAVIDKYNFEIILIFQCFFQFLELLEKGGKYLLFIVQRKHYRYKLFSFRHRFP